jgi:hypothetical protein
MRKFLVLTSALLALGGLGGLAGCAGNTADPTPAESTATGQGALTVTQETEYAAAGTWTYAGQTVQFESTVSDEGLSTVKLTVNGAAFDTTFDYFTHAWQADGHKNTLFREELDALVKLEKKLDEVGKLGRPWERLFAAVSQHAAAPAGYTFMVRAGSPSAPAEKQHREAGSVSNDGVTYICRGTNGRNFSNSWDYAYAEHDSFAGEGSSNATQGNQMHARMVTLSPGGCQVGSTGHGMCEGRCGAGCPRTYNFYFTKDCLDHDICLDYHPAAPGVSYSGDCGYEFGDADGDFAGGTSGGYYVGCPGSVPSNCPESGNAVGAGT